MSELSKPFETTGRYWYDMGRLFYPDVIFEQPADFYVLLSADIARNTMPVSVEVPPQFAHLVGEAAMYRMILSSQDNLAYTMASQAIRSDFTAGTHDELDKLLHEKTKIMNGNFDIDQHFVHTFRLNRVREHVKKLWGDNLPDTEL